MPPAETVTRENRAEAGLYPPPLASHEDVVRDPTLFWDTLTNFHSEFGTKYMVPVIGGKDLNLHILYAEVTKRGGFEKVVAEKKWREISLVFNFSPTTTSASYALRKHYFSILHQYEQVYFFKLQGPQAIEVTGTIDKKCDCGYLVSIPVGDEVLNGIIYFPDHPSSSNNKNYSITQPSMAMIPYEPAIDVTGGRSRRRKRRKRGGDPGRPKPNRSGYNFFFQEKHAVLKTLYPEKEREFTKMIGESWNSLSQEERIARGYMSSWAPCLYNSIFRFINKKEWWTKKGTNENSKHTRIDLCPDNKQKLAYLKMRGLIV